MKHKAEKNLASIAEWDCTPKCEDEVKETLGYIIENGDHEEIADAIEEVSEWAVANLMIKYGGADTGSV